MYSFYLYLSATLVHPDGHLSIHPSICLSIRYRICSICERKKCARNANMSVTHWILSSSREDFSLFLKIAVIKTQANPDSLISQEDCDNSKLASVRVKSDLLQV